MNIDTLYRGQLFPEFLSLVHKENWKDHKQP